MATDSLSNLLDQITQNRIVLPQFQRDFVWPVSAAKRLLSSLLNSYPIGSLLLMENPGHYDFRPLDGIPAQSRNQQETTLVLDGQQRLTSIFRIFGGTLDPSAKNAGRYYFDYGTYIRDRIEGLDVAGSEVEDYILFERPNKIRRTLETHAAEIAKGYLPLDIVFQSPRGMNYVEWLNQFTFDMARGIREEFDKLNKIQGEFATKFIQNVTAYQISFDRITRDTNPDVIATIFETINTTGLKLTVFDLLVAKCFKDDIRLRDDLEAFLEANPEVATFDPEGARVCVTQLPRIISLLHNRQCKKGDILKLDPSILRDHWEKATVALSDAVSFLTDRCGVPKVDYLPTLDVVSPLAYIISHADFSKKRHDAMLQQWYWSVSFNQRFSGAPESKTAKECRDWFGKGGWGYDSANVPESCEEFGIRPEDLKDATRASTIYKTVFTFLIANGGWDLGIDKEGGRKQLAELRAHEIEDHHIFPRQFLYSNNIKGSKANGILNRTPISLSANRAIGSLAPHVYILDDEKVGEIKQEHLSTLGMSEALLKSPFTSETYESFLNDRSQRIINLVSATLPNFSSDA